MTFSQYFEKHRSIPRATIDALMNEVNRNGDSVGLDPWGLRQLERANTSIGDVQARLYQDLSFNLNSALDSTAEFRLKNIPKLVHFIWIGTWFSNPVYRKVVAEWAQNNPDYQIILWHHALEKNDADALELSQWANESRVVLRDVKKTLIGNMPLIETNHGKIRMDDIYANEIVRRQFAGASDALRLAIVYYFGGIYCDIDNRCIAPLGTISAEHGILYHCGYFKFFKQKTSQENDFFNPNHFTLVDTNTFTNDIFAATRHHQHLHELMCNMCEDYLISNAQLFSKAFSVPDQTGFNRNIFSYDGNDFKWPSGESINTARIVYLGPRIFSNFMERKNIKDSSFLDPISNLIPDYALPYDALAFYQSYSWRSKEVLFSQDESEEMLIKHIVTIILNDLSREPRVLHLDQFASTINNKNIIDEIIEVLFTCFADEVSRLETVHLTDLWMTQTSMDFLINKRNLQTNYEAQFKHYFKPIVSINAYQEIHKFMFLSSKLNDSFMKSVFDMFINMLEFNFPIVIRDEYNKICDFLDVNPNLSACKTRYRQCDSRIIYPEYADWLSRQSPESELTKFNVILTLYSYVRKSWSGIHCTDQEEIIRELKQSAYTKPEFHNHLIFEPTLENYVSHLIDMVKTIELDAKYNSKLIALVCRNWREYNIGFINETLLEILLSRTFLHILPKDANSFFGSATNLVELADKYQVEPLKTYFSRTPELQ